MKKTFLFLLGLSACASTPQLIPPSSSNTVNTQYLYDLTGDINGIPFTGVGVMPLSKSNQYTLHVTSKYAVQLMTITTCHRDYANQDHPIDPGGLFDPGHEFTFNFSLAHGIEDFGTCILRIGAYNNKGNPQQWAVIDFDTPDSTLPATNKCNGAQGRTGGVSICQSKAGLDEEIDFDAPVLVSDQTSPQCKPTPPKDGVHWVYTLPVGECVVYFMEKAAPHRFHRHDFLGYQSIQIQN